MKRKAAAKEAKTVTVELECLNCRTHESVDLSPEKFQALSSSWKIDQECDTCGKSTEWSFAEAAVEAEEQVDLWDWLATTGEYLEGPGAGPQDERRKERRVEIRVPLRVAGAGGDEEDVTSENISKSGVCFSSAKTYAPGETIRITLQPAGAVTPLKKAATIVRVGAPEDGKVLYGARLEE